MWRIIPILLCFVALGLGCLGPSHSVRYYDQQGDDITELNIVNRGGLFGKTIGTGQGAMEVGEAGDYKIIVGQEAETRSDAEKLIDLMAAAFQAGLAAAIVAP